jgi:hypothetical protein
MRSSKTCSTCEAVRRSDDTSQRQYRCKKRFHDRSPCAVLLPSWPRSNHSTERDLIGLAPIGAVLSRSVAQSGLDSRPRVRGGLERRPATRILFFRSVNHLTFARRPLGYQGGVSPGGGCLGKARHHTELVCGRRSRIRSLDQGQCLYRFAPGGRPFCHGRSRRTVCGTRRRVRSSRCERFGGCRVVTSTAYAGSVTAPHFT